MKNGVCPKCRGKKLYVIDEATIEGQDSSNMVYTASYAAHYGPSGETGLFGTKSKRTIVKYSVYVCAACAFSETYVSNLDVLAKFAAERLASCRELP